MHNITTHRAVSSSHDVRLRLLVLSIAFIFITTMIPLGLRHPSRTFIDYTHSFNDVFGNILLYMPLGFFLPLSSIKRRVLCGFCLSLCAETLQLFYVHRTPSPVDVTTNTTGAFAGAVLAVLLSRYVGAIPRLLTFPRLLAAFGIPVAVVATWVLTARPTVANFSNWDSNFHFALGNELDHERPWSGVISRLAIYDTSISPAEIRDLDRESSDAAASFQQHLVYRLEAPLTLNGTVVTPLSLDQEQQLFRRLVTANRISILVWLTTSNLAQTGPARIVTFSQDAFSRNFTIGQIGELLTFRLRTPTSGWNGNEPGLITGPVLSANKLTFVAAVYDGRFSTVYVDGRLAKRVDVGAQLPQLPSQILWRLSPYITPQDLDLIACEVSIGGVAALGLFGIIGVGRPRSQLLWLALAFSGLFGAAIWYARITSPRMGVYILLETMLGAFIVWSALETSREIQ